MSTSKFNLIHNLCKYKLQGDLDDWHHSFENKIKNTLKHKRKIRKWGWIITISLHPASMLLASSLDQLVNLREMEHMEGMEQMGHTNAL